MILHCGFSNNMKIKHHNISDELFCAMRVHLMNETEVHTFCPADARIWNDNCQDVEFMNYTAVGLLLCIYTVQFVTLLYDVDQL